MLLLVLWSVLWIVIVGMVLVCSYGGYFVDFGVFSLFVWVDWVYLFVISVWVGFVYVVVFIVMFWFVGELLVE